jgi:Protein of unknown function (DUF4065)
MIITHNREKLLNAIIFFCRHTAGCYATKLYKLLYFLDFEHYKETGRSVTGLDYFALPMGPVPQELRDEINESPQPDFVEKIDVEIIPLKSGKRMFNITPKAEFDQSYFTKRELRIMESLALEYDLATADEMVEATHLPTLPWHRRYKVEGRKWEIIPYEYGVPDDRRELVNMLATDAREMLHNYQ